MVDFINEVEDELRKDQYNALLKRWGPLIAAIAVIIVAAAGAYEYFKSADAREANKASISYVKATDIAQSGDSDLALKQFIAISEKAKPGYAGLSLMQAAGIKVVQGDKDGAIALFDKAALTFETPLHSQLSQLKAAYLLADQGRYDDVRQRLMPMSENGQPFAHLARELLGFVALNEGDLKGARSQFAFLSLSPDVAQGVKERAEQILALTPSLAKLAADEREAARLDAAAKAASQPANADDVKAPQPITPEDAKQLADPKKDTPE